MSIFKPIEVRWNGGKRMIPSNRAMLAAAHVEEVISLSKLATMLNDGNPPLVKISQAYGALLEFAGFEKSNADCADLSEEVYLSMFNGDDTTFTLVQDAISTLMIVMTPPKSLIDKSSGGKSKAAPRKTRQSGANSTRRQSATTKS